MKKLLFLAILILFSFSAFAAPTGKLTGRVADAADSTAISGATVELFAANGQSTKRRATTSGRGAFTIGNLPYGEYDMTISVNGFNDIVRKVSVTAEDVDLGLLKMEQTAMVMDAVTVEVQVMRTSQNGDTVSYNANAFKVAKDADAEGLLAKLPGVRIVDGTVEAQGETVKKVFVDGKEFFGEDVNSAIKNLPAEAIAKIEVYNKQSDQSELTGIDDGQGYKAINIVTRPDMRQGQFGKLYAGYGIPDKYIVGGNVNIFSGTNRWSLIGLSNNMNQQNFSMEDILGVSGGSSSGRYSRGGGGHSRRGGGGDFMVPQQSGISKVNSFGLNYSGEWGKKITFSGSYFFNTNGTENHNQTNQRYYEPVDSPRVSSSTSDSGSRNYNNRFNARVEYKINDNHSIMYRPSISFQTNNSTSSGNSLTGLGIMENNMLVDTELKNTTDQSSRANGQGYNISNSLLYRAKLGKPGRTLSVDGSLTLTKNDNDAYSLQQTVYTDGTPERIDNQHKINNTDYMRLRASLMYTEPLSEKAQVNLNYRFSYNDQPADRKVYMWNPLTQSYMGDIDPSRSNIYSSRYMTNGVGPGFNYGTKKTTLVFNLNYQNSSLLGDRTFPEPAAKTDARFNNIVYFGMLNQTFAQNNTLRVFMRSSTDNPSVSQLQDTPNQVSTQYVTVGNSKLKPSYEHSVYMNYNRSMVDKGRTLMVMLGASVRNNYIADSLTQLAFNEGYNFPNSDVSVGKGGQIMNYVNMNGYRSVRGMVTYGSSIKWIKCNFNVNAGVDYGRTPSYTDAVENISNTLSYNGGAVLSSNISENLDFTLRYSLGYNTVRNTSGESKDNDFLNQRVEGSLKWVMWGGFTFATNALYIKYSTKEGNNNQDYCIVNALVGKKIFRNQRGEVNVGVNDLFNQNRSYNRSFQTAYLQESRNDVIGRYVSVNLIYNLRNFGKRKPGNYDNGEGSGDRGRHMMMGPPPGGGPGGGFHGH